MNILKLSEKIYKNINTTDKNNENVNTFTNYCIEKNKYSISDMDELLNLFNDLVYDIVPEYFNEKNNEENKHNNFRNKYFSPNSSARIESIEDNEQYKDDMRELKTDVTQLRATADKWRGGFWVMMALGGVVGVVANLAMGWFK